MTRQKVEWCVQRSRFRLGYTLFALYSLLLLSFFLYLKSVPIHVIVHVLKAELAFIAV